MADTQNAIYAQAYGQNIMQLAQQKYSKLMNAVYMRQNVRGKTFFQDQITKRLSTIPEAVQEVWRNNAQASCEEVFEDDPSPWGLIETAVRVEPGIQLIRAAEGHGIKLATGPNETVLADFRKVDGWYPSDEWIIPVCFHPWAFPVDRVILAHHLMREYCLPLYETLIRAVADIDEEEDADCSNPDCVSNKRNTGLN
jgi:hypothetical protein